AAFTDSGPVEEEGQNSFAFPSILSEQAQIEAADNFSVEVAGDNTATDKVVDTTVVTTGNPGVSVDSAPLGPRQRTRQRSSRGGQTTRNQEATRAQQPKAPASGWQPTLRAADQVVQQAEFSSVHTSSSVRPLPKQSRGVVEPVAKPLQPPKHQQGVAVPKERGTTVIAAKASGSAPSSAAVPEAPKAAKLPSPPSSPPPVVPSNIPPPPQHPPPTPEELAARAPAFAKARETVGGNQEEEEESFEVESEEEPAPVAKTASPREREQIELARELRAAGYPDTRVDSAGTWVRVAGPSVATAAERPVAHPVVVPGTETQEVEGIDPYKLEDAAWQNPSLSSRRVVLVTPNLQSSDIVNLTTRDPDTEEEGTEDPALASQRFQETGRSFIAAASAEPIEADPAPPGYLKEQASSGKAFLGTDPTEPKAPAGQAEGAAAAPVAQRGEESHDRALSFLTLVEEWLKQEGVDSILQRRAARAVPKEHLRPPFGDKQR
ncbi:unnamed protein product, partial [Cladocopium goreaui]